MLVKLLILMKHEILTVIHDIPTQITEHYQGHETDEMTTANDKQSNNALIIGLVTQ